ncbi:hypothetical protein [Tardiphaga sp. 285_C5_N1_2]|uniref:hypothetical protein n=1 Tax=Tardiphaga sp. 285_C5_N1_2 TaxID=3240775 RepID=UPI003F8C4EAC
MTQFTAPDSAGRMGRPPLGNRSTNVRISEEVKDRIRELVGDKGMAQFIRDAIDEKLAKREQSTKKRK